MALEIAMLMLAGAITLTILIRFLIVPLVQWLFGPTLRIIEAQHRRRIAEAELKIAEEEAKALEVEHEKDEIFSKVIHDMTKDNKHGRS
jgi:hypothetical protein